MLSDVMTAIINGYHSDIPLSAAITTPMIDEMRADPVFGQAIEAMMVAGLTTSQTSHIYDGEVHYNLFNDRGWTAGLIRPRMANGMAYTSPGPTAIVLVSGSSQEHLGKYPAPGYRLALLSDVSRGKLGQRESIRIEPWDVPAIECDNNVYHLEVTDGEAVWLRVNGPPECAYTHGFDARTGDYCYSTFAEVANTQNDFLSKMFKELSSSSEFSIDSHLDTKSSLVEACDFLLTGPHTAPPSQWNIVQTLARIAPEKARAVLTSLADRPGELQSHARRVLQANAERVDAS